MTPQYLMTKSLCRADSGKHQDLRSFLRRATFEIEDMRWSDKYAEAGYSTNAKRGILFANWNYFPRNTTDLLERMGYEIKWSDEWTFCEDCQGAIRIQADSYSWKAGYFFDEADGTLTCESCVLADESLTARYVEAVSYNPYAVPRNDVRSITFDGIDLTKLGYTLIEADLENGLHPHQTDNPQAIGQKLAAYERIVFTVDTVSAFDCGFSVWGRLADSDEDSDNND